MSGRRLVVTTAAVWAIAVVLRLLAPSWAEMTGAVRSAQRTVDTTGAEALLQAVTGLAAWAVWAWGALGLALTAVAALPGALGSAAALLSRVVLPRAARRGAALVLGAGLAVTGPAAGTALLVVAAPAATATPSPAGPPPAAVPDWPGSGPADRGAPEPGPEPGPGIPPAPPPRAAGEHVVVRGDCLWDLAADHLVGRLGRPPTGGEIARATHAWWTTNAAVIGPDPDLLLPGQVLRPPPG